MKDNKLNSQTLSISFSKSNSNGENNYRGISDSSSVHLHSTNSIYQPITIISPQHTIKSNHNYPSKTQPLDILTTPISIIDTTISQPPSLATNTLKHPFEYCNELNSYLMENINSHQVLKNLNNILNTKFTDIDFKIDYNNSQINGLIFMQSYVVYFTLYVWYNNTTNNTQIEFRRTSGDALASAKLWSQIKGNLNQNQNQTETENKTETFDLIELELPQLPPMSMDNIPFNNTYDKIQMNSLMETLIQNDLYIVDELNYLYELIMENKTICNDILDNKLLMKQLVNETLLNKDIAVVRIVLMILNELVCELNIIGSNYKLFENINLLLNNKQMLIKKYTIKLLGNLCMIKSKWDINEFERKLMVKNIKKYQNECNNLNYEIMKKINQKLMVN
eukprot:285112_1